MIQSDWKRICGLSLQSDGVLAGVWIALDHLTDTCHLYDTITLNREVPAVIVECITARGKWIPVSWSQSAKELIGELLSRGVNTITEPIKEDDCTLEMAAINIEERMRSSRFKVDERLKPWLEEFRSFRRTDAKIPREGYPLMMATQYAMARLSWAKRQSVVRGQKIYPRINVL